MKRNHTKVRPRFPIDPLIEAVGFENRCQLARALGLLKGTVNNAVARGGWQSHKADQYAIYFGLHPLNVWPDFYDDVDLVDA